MSRIATEIGLSLVIAGLMTVALRWLHPPLLLSGATPLLIGAGILVLAWGIRGNHARHT